MLRSIMIISNLLFLFIIVISYYLLWNIHTTIRQKRDTSLQIAKQHIATV